MTRIEKFLLLLFIYLLQSSTASVLYNSLKGLEADTWLYRIAAGLILVVGGFFIWWPRED